jgi:nitrogenase molybdenum-iron protein beta chain
MAKILDQPRYKCALAAMQTVNSISGAIPILHSGPGCAAKLNDNAGAQGTFGPGIFPCTSVSETEIVFGGERKLHDTIENALKVIDAELFVVMTGCTAEIIGDDAVKVTSDFAQADKPVICVQTPGFKGNNYQGHDWVLTAIFDQYLPDENPPVEPGSVNLFTGPPQQDPFWLGNQRELARLLSLLGLKVNTIFGHAGGLASLKRVPAAEFNILASPWVGLESVEFLAQKYGTPYLHYPVLPIGAFETSKFLRAVTEFTGIDAAAADQLIEREEADYYHYIERFADIFLEMRLVSKRFAVVSDAQYSLAVTKFLVNDLGMFPSTQFITDDTPEVYRPLIEREFKNLNYGVEATVEFATDGHEIHATIRREHEDVLPTILGSSWEKKLAADMNCHYVNISYPVIERLIMNSALTGYAGGLKLLEDIYSAALSRFIL